MLTTTNQKISLATPIPDVSSPNYLTLTALGENKSNFIYALTESINKCNCTVMNSKFTVMGKEATASILVAGNWGKIAKLETMLHNLERKLAITITQKRTVVPEVTDKIYYMAHAITLNKPGMLHHLVSFFNKRHLEIDSINSNTFATNTKVEMVDLSIRVKIATKINTLELREQFLSLCESLSVDASFEPQYF
jgi:glycine cleavage system regulatory protein